MTAVVEGAKVTKNIEQLVDNIAPAADQARKAFPQLSGPRLVDKAIRANVNCAAADLLKNSELLRSRVASGKLKIVGGVYNLHSGEVDWLEPATANGFAAGEHASPVSPAHDTHTLSKDRPKHDAKPADAHSRASDGHGSADKEHDDHATPAKAPTASRMGKDNLPLLGGMLAAGGAMSYGITYVVGRTRAAKAHAAAAAKDAPAP